MTGQSPNKIPSKTAHLLGGGCIVDGELADAPWRIDQVGVVSQVSGFPAVASAAIAVVIFAVCCACWA